MLPNGFAGKKSCCFTGHRPSGLPGGGRADAPEMERLRYLLRHSIEMAVHLGIDAFWAGGAEGFDTVAAESVLLLKREYHPQLKLHLALPAKTQAQAFTPAMRARYERILSAASSVYYASEESCGASALMARNRYLVDHADCCIAYLAHMSGGTLYTVNYALACEIPVYNLALCDKS